MKLYVSKLSWTVSLFFYIKKINKKYRSVHFVYLSQKIKPALGRTNNKLIDSHWQEKITQNQKLMSRRSTLILAVNNIPALCFDCGYPYFDVISLWASSPGVHGGTGVFFALLPECPGRACSLAMMSLISTVYDYCNLISYSHAKTQAFFSRCLCI